VKTKLAGLSIAAIALLAAGATLSSAGVRTAGHSGEIAPILRGFDVIKPVSTVYVDAGGISKSTGELLTGEPAYLVTHIERPDGSVHPAFGHHPRGMLLSMTEGGHFVVRFLDIPSDRGWAGNY
jgi:hypothetical protein